MRKLDYVFAVRGAVRKLGMNNLREKFGSFVFVGVLSLVAPEIGQEWFNCVCSWLVGGS